MGAVKGFEIGNMFVFLCLIMFVNEIIRNKQV